MDAEPQAQVSRMACSISGQVKTVPLLLQRCLSLVVVERGQELVHIQVNGKAILELLPLLEVTNKRTKKKKLTQQNVHSEHSHAGKEHQAKAL